MDASFWGGDGEFNRILQSSRSFQLSSRAHLSSSLTPTASYFDFLHGKLRYRYKLYV